MSSNSLNHTSRNVKISQGHISRSMGSNMERVQILVKIKNEGQDGSEKVIFIWTYKIFLTAQICILPLYIDLNQNRFAKRTMLKLQQ